MKASCCRTLLATLLVAVPIPHVAAQIQLNPTVDTFLSSPRPNGIGDGSTTCCNANPVPLDELISSHNVMEVDTNQGGNGPVEPLMYFDLSTEIEEGRGTLAERFAATEGATASLQFAIVNGFDPLVMRRITADWLTIDAGGAEISRSNFPGAPADLMESAFVPGTNIEATSTTVPDPAVANQQNGLVVVDVTADVIAWAEGSSNFGWAFSPGASQGGTIVATENEDIPIGLIQGIEFTEADLPALRPTLTLSSPDGLPLKPTGFIGDFDRSNTVDLEDFLILVRNFNVGMTFEEGDNNSDGIVNLRDFIELRAAFAAAGEPAMAASVPEPASHLAFIAAVACLPFLRRRVKR